MLTIRLQRTGRKHEPTFRVVLTDSKNGPKSGKYLKNLGWYDSRIKNKPDQIDMDAVKYWISKGAQTSVTFHNFLVTHKVIDAKKINALPKRTPIKRKEETAPATEAAPAASPAPAPAVEVASTAPENPANP